MTADRPDAKTTFAEYRQPKIIQRYRRETAGQGINYLLDRVYCPLLLEQANQALREAQAKDLRILEFGCGAAMALQHLGRRLRAGGDGLELAVGADFVPGMIEAANADADELGLADDRRFRFVVAANEELVDRLSEELADDLGPLEGTFQLAFGINTFRYAVRHGTAGEVVTQLRRLLAPQGRVVMIDMNNRFPYGLKPTMAPRGSKQPLSFGTGRLPTLEEYARPFADGGFEVLKTGYFCWIPHSANGARFHAARLLTPLLDTLTPTSAMRSLIIARRR